MTSVYKDAVLSEDGVYRYELYRRWADNTRPVLWVMLNPSTADAEIDDPTIRRVIGFSQSWGFQAAIVCNLFALRATNPQALRTHSDPVGPDNDDYLMRAVCASDRIVVAWGAHPFASSRAAWVKKLLPNSHCLGVTKEGHPRHPLYARADAQLVKWGTS